MATILKDVLCYVTGYNPKHELAIKLEADLKSAPGLMLSDTKRKKTSRQHIEGAIKTLMAADPKAFDKAIEKGTGPFIQCMEAAVAAGHGNMIVERDFNPFSMEIFHQTEEGYYVKTTYYKEGKKDEAVIFVSEIPAVSSVLLANLSYSSSSFSFLTRRHFSFVEVLCRFVGSIRNRI